MVAKPLLAEVSQPPTWQGSSPDSAQMSRPQEPYFTSMLPAPVSLAVPANLWVNSHEWEVA